MRTRVTDLLGIKHPVLMGGMAGASDATLVGAVSRAGGLGILGASNLSPATIEAEVAGIREVTPMPFGVNLLLWSASYKVDAVLELQPAVLSTAWGNPSPFVEAAHESGVLVVHLVNDVPGAIAAALAGVDLIVAQGHEGGGHVGLQSTFTLVPQVVDAAGDIPVVAAGGIADGRGLAAALALGAEGVMMGTRFLATQESPIHENWKRAILEAEGHQTVHSPVIDIANEADWPPPAAARSIRNAFLERWLGREAEVRGQSTALGRELSQAKRDGNADEMALLAGEAVGLIHDLPTVEEVIDRIVREAEGLLPQLAAKTAGKRRPKDSS